MARLAFLIVSALAVTACYEDNLASCERPENRDTPACMDDPMTGGPCTSNAQCTSPALPVCELSINMGTCVQCTATEKDECTGATPRCEANQCVACVDDGDCGDRGVCLIDGSCAAPARIIHARPDGSNGGGCGTIGSECSLPTALSEVDGTRNVIKLQGGTYVTGGFDADEDVTIDMRGATLRRDNNGPVFTVDSNRTVVLLGGTIENAAAGGGDGIRCANSAVLTVHETVIRNNEESAIDSTDCTLTVTAARLTDNSRKTMGVFPGIAFSGGVVTMSRSSITGTKGGGMTITNNAQFVIVGNAFLNNGVATGNVGGLSILTTMDSKNRLEFNTIAGNTSLAGDTAGMSCSAGSFTARNNIIWGNLGGSAIGGSCTHAYSNIGPNTPPSGTNTSVDPMLINLMTDVHLQATSPMKRAADPQADITGLAARDIDGDPRTAPADVGADQTR